MSDKLGVIETVKPLQAAVKPLQDWPPLSLQSFLREGRVVGLCWANQHLKDLTGWNTCAVPSYHPLPPATRRESIQGGPDREIAHGAPYES